MDSNEYREALKAQKRVMIGHNRFATIGEVDKKNAHPFYCKHIIGTHNGTLQNKYNIDSDNKFSTDSEAIFSYIANNDIKDTWGKINGDTALVYWDNSTKELNIIRNNRRQVYYAMLADGSGMLWASEHWMITAVAYRRGISLQKNEKGSTKTTYPLPNDLITFKFKNNKIIMTLKTLPPYSLNYKIPAYEKPKGFRNYINNTFGLIGDSIPDHKHSKDCDWKDDWKRNKEGKHNFILNTYIEESDFHKKFPYCVFCGETLIYQYKESMIIDDNHAACEACQTVAKMDKIDIMTVHLSG